MYEEEKVRKKSVARPDIYNRQIHPETETLHREAGP